MSTGALVLIATLAAVPLAAGATVYAAPASTRATAQPRRPSPQLAWPAAVEAAFKQKYPKAIVTAVSKETEDGKTVYEVESTDNGRHRDIDYNLDGTIVRYEEELTEAEVPAVVRAAVNTRYPKASVKSWERLYTIADNSANYECQLTAADVSEVILTPDGRWISPRVRRLTAPLHRRDNPN